MARFTGVMSLLLFSLLLLGMIFAPQHVLGNNLQETTLLSQQASHIHYELNTQNPQLLEAVEFTLPAGAVQGQVVVEIRLSADAAWYVCSAMQTSWFCPTPDRPAVAQLNSLELRIDE